jgi:hypothetical protein
MNRAITGILGEDWFALMRCTEALWPAHDALQSVFPPAQCVASGIVFWTSIQIVTMRHRDDLMIARPGLAFTGMVPTLNLGSAVLARDVLAVA